MDESARRPSPLTRVIRFLGDYRGVVALVAVFALGVVVSPRNLRTGEIVFLTSSNQSNVLFEYAEYGLLAVGMTIVILTGGIDLSVGSVLGFSATLFSYLVIALGWSVGPAVLVCLVAGGLAGFLSGTLVSRLRMQPFIATLSMMVAARGAAKLVSGGIKVAHGAQPWYVLQAGPPAVFGWMSAPVAGGWLRPITLIFLLVLAIMAVVVRYTRFGRYLYAIGGNEEAARLSGVRVTQVKTVAYLLCGLTAAVAGICNASHMGYGDPEAGATYELDAIAAVVIGGTSMMGGRGGMVLTLLGTLIIGYVNKILSLMGWQEAPRLLAKGLIIVLAVIIQETRRRRK
ncbi:MAG TPA: ABC transporter permease [Armatimonadota bacterium]|jgi:ribose transport system permease protein